MGQKATYKETKRLLNQIEKVDSVTGDKGYDNKNAYEPIAARGAKAIIPPRSGAALKRPAAYEIAFALSIPFFG